MLPPLLKYIHPNKNEYMRVINNTLLNPVPQVWTYPISTKSFLFSKVWKGTKHYFSPELCKFYTEFTNANRLHLYSTRKPLFNTPRLGIMTSHTYKSPNFSTPLNDKVSEVCLIVETSMNINAGVGPTIVLLPIIIALCSRYYNSEVHTFDYTRLYGDKHINFSNLPLVEGYLNFTNEFNILLSRCNLSTIDQQVIKLSHDEFISKLSYLVNTKNLSTEQTSLGLELFIEKTFYSDLSPESIALLINECFSLVPL